MIYMLFEISPAFFLNVATASTKQTILHFVLFWFFSLCWLLGQNESKIITLIHLM